MKSDTINIGVTGTGSLIGQAIIKCIKLSALENRISITGFDYLSNTIGSYWCDKNYTLPDIFKKNADEQYWYEELISHIKSNRLSILFIGIDFELPVFARLKGRIETETNCCVIVSDEEVIKTADDKYLTAEFLRKHTLPYPVSFTKETYIPGTFNYPLIIKPRIGARSVGFNLIKSQQEFESVINTISEPIIQECIGTMNTEYTCGVICFDNEIKASIALLRTLKEGNTFTANYSKDIPVIIYEYLKDVSKVLKPFGVVNFQLRLDNNGIPKIFEINARHSGTTYMRALFGYNEIEYIICYLLKLPLPVMDNLNEGKVIRFYDEFFIENKK